MNHHTLLLALLANACSGSDGTTGGDAGSDTGGDTGQVDEGPPPPTPGEPSDGECPDLSESGSSSFSSGGEERDVSIYFPEDRPVDMPVVFMWHPLGASASQLVSYLDLDDLAEDLGVVVVVPDAMSSNLVEWGFLTDGAEDLALYDDVRSCLYSELAIDLRRVSSTGMSAGGLWTSFLGMHRGDTLATALIMSGGSEPVIDYSTPAYQFPAMLMYGGDDDTWGGGGFEIDFQATTLALSDELADDGHFVVLCNHERGHNFPLDPIDVASNWLMAHSYGSPSPFVDDISSLPEYCAVQAASDGR
jgi:predicted esterase